MFPLRRSLSSLSIPHLRSSKLTDHFRAPSYELFDTTPLSYQEHLWQPNASSNKTLQSLVRSRNFASADLLRVHMLSAAVTIEPSLLYISAAADIIRTYPYKPPDDTQRVASFADWFSLIPSRHMLPNHRYNWVSLKPVERMIFDRGNPATDHIPLAIIYALTCASKGFSSKASSIIIPFILQSTPPGVSVNFLLEFETRAVDYARSHGFMPTNAHGLSVRMCVAMGWFSQGAILVLEQGMDCDTQTLAALMDGLKKYGKQGLLERLEVVQREKDSKRPLVKVPLDSHSGRLPGLRRELPLSFPGRTKHDLSW